MKLSLGRSLSLTQTHVAPSYYSNSSSLGQQVNTFNRCLSVSQLLRMVCSRFHVLLFFYFLVTHGQTSGGACPSGSIYSQQLNKCVSSPCPAEWTYFELADSCYKVSTRVIRRVLKVFLSATWNEAEADCSRQESHLASILSQEENDFVNGSFLW